MIDNAPLPAGQIAFGELVRAALALASTYLIATGDERAARAALAEKARAFVEAEKATQAAKSTRRRGR